MLLAGEESDPLFSLFPSFRLFTSIPEPFLASASWALGLSLTLSFRAPQPIQRIPTAGYGSPATRTALGILSSFGDDVVIFFYLTRNLKYICSVPLLFSVHLILFSGS